MVLPSWIHVPRIVTKIRKCEKTDLPEVQAFALISRRRAGVACAKSAPWEKIGSGGTVGFCSVI
jgi:hypothetical protein